jgi:DNA polymerase III epsilon subunit-like protein
MAEEIIKLADVQPDYEKYPYVCLDTETTGFGDYDEVIEITLIEHNEKGEKGAMLHYMCEPLKGYIPEDAAAVNGIKWEDVEGQPNFLVDGVREECAKFIGQRTVVAHNAPFDLRMMKIKPVDVYDTLAEARKRYANKRSRKLKSVCEYIGIPWDDEKAHRASYDVEQTIKVFTYFHNPENLLLDLHGAVQENLSL